VRATTHSLNAGSESNYKNGKLSELSQGIGDCVYTSVFMYVCMYVCMHEGM